ncbi:polyprenyl synthetase family protein [Devosia sp. ZB163]|uniref:polyprenyl synthetase family protein n=1 Tax=Devosia sp. ZB163 TaxID=3025938 RepID=UPI002361C730|nr:farnesyl diphosphate synthase [Devosia sp. ZB163]MDC9826428.1 polyprenyl synthetase family protein [Devosia sp. ZB163]
MTYSFSAELKSTAADIERALDRFIAAGPLSGPGLPPDRLIAATRHGTLNGGKRLRPLLVRQAAGVFGVPPETTVTAGLAVEMIHCYSLIHDDLPAMDDDDLRRGQPTVHKAYDEATAILAGDALLTHAFGLLASDEAHTDPVVRIRLVAELAAGAGAGGMVGGQMRDIEGETGFLTERAIAQMQAMKTGALIRAAVRMGAILGGASDEQFGRLTTYAEAAGRAFQLADDILDVTATTEAMGKATGKDADKGKQTIVARIGVEAARRELAEVIHDALGALITFDTRADGLRETAKFFAERMN